MKRKIAEIETKEGEGKEAKKTKSEDTKIHTVPRKVHCDVVSKELYVYFPTDLVSLVSEYVFEKCEFCSTIYHRNESLHTSQYFKETRNKRCGSCPNKFCHRCRKDESDTHLIECHRCHQKLCQTRVLPCAVCKKYTCDDCTRLACKCKRISCGVCSKDVCLCKGLICGSCAPNMKFHTNILCSGCNKLVRSCRNCVSWETPKGSCDLCFEVYGTWKDTPPMYHFVPG